MAWTMRSWSAKPTAPYMRPSGWGGIRSRPPCSLRTSHKLPPNFPFPDRARSRRLPGNFFAPGIQVALLRVDAGAGRGCRTGGTEMRYEEFEVMQTRFNDLDRRLQLILLGWVVSIAAFMVGLRLLTANAALLSVIH